MAAQGMIALKLAGLVARPTTVPRTGLLALDAIRSHCTNLIKSMSSYLRAPTYVLGLLSSHNNLLFSHT